MFSFGGSEFLIIVVLALLLFGPDKIPQLARTVGRFMREFNKYKSIMESTLNAEIYRAEGPTTDTLTVEERIAKAGAASTALTQAREAALASVAATEEKAKSPEGELDAEGASAAFAKAQSSAPRPVAVPSADEADEEDEE